MVVSDRLLKSLSELKYPVARLVYKGSADTYFTFQKKLELPTNHADDGSADSLHVFRVNLFTKNNYTELLSKTKDLLKQVGFNIESVDAEFYENETGFYHASITINYMEEM